MLTTEAVTAAGGGLLGIHRVLYQSATEDVPKGGEAMAEKARQFVAAVGC